MTLAPAAALGPTPLIFRATTKIGGKDYAIIPPPVVIEVIEPKKKRASRRRRGAEEEGGAEGVKIDSVGQKAHARRDVRRIT